MLKSSAYFDFSEEILVSWCCGKDSGGPRKGKCSSWAQLSFPGDLADFYMLIYFILLSFEEKAVCGIS